MKSNIALPPFHISEITRFTVEADHELTQTLRRYQAFYKEVYGAMVTEAELLREMARRFMANDGDFQGFGHYSQGEGTHLQPGPEQARDGNAQEGAGTGELPPPRIAGQPPDDQGSCCAGRNRAHA